MVGAVEEGVVEEEEVVAAKPHPTTQQQTLGGRLLDMPTCHHSAHANVTGSLANQVLYASNQLHALGETTSSRRLKIERLTNSRRRRIVTTD